MVAISFHLRMTLIALLLTLGAAKANPQSTEKPVPFTTQKLKLQWTDGPLLQATLRLPQGLGPGQKIPVLLIFGGFESAGMVLDLVHSKQPMALASFDYPFSGSRGLKFPEDLKALPEAKRLFPTTVRGIMELTKILKNRSDIDSKLIIGVGASFGSPFVLAAAAQDPGISRVVLVHAFGQAPKTAEHVILRSWLPRYGWISRPVAWLLTRVGWLYLNIEPPEYYARQLTLAQRALLITASQDTFIPQSASDSLWGALKQSQAQVTRIFMTSNHLMPGSEKLIDQIIHEVERWLGNS